MNQYLVSVIIPVYNGEQWIERAVMSVMNQPTSSFVEVLIINDGSTDRSQAISDALSSRYSNVLAIHKPNGGVSSARNHGIQEATGKYVAFLDCDDWWEPDFLSQQILELLENNTTDVYQFAYSEINTYYSLKKTYHVKPIYSIFTTNSFGRYNWAPHCSFLFRKSFLYANQLTYPYSKSFEDCTFVNMVMYLASSYHAIDCCMFNYWENPTSRVHSSSAYSALMEHKNAAQQQKAYFANRGIPLNGDIAWTITASFPKLCGELDFDTLYPFMQANCIEVLAQRPEERYRPSYWRRIQLWKWNPKACYILYRYTSGALWIAKNRLLRLNTTSKWFNYLYTRFYRGFTPIKTHHKL